MNRHYRTARDLSKILMLLGLALSIFMGNPESTFAQAGELDATFGDGGKVQLDFGLSEVAWQVAIQTDGKIVIAGDRGLLNANFDFAVARLNTDGSLDESFGDNGLAMHDFGLTDMCRGIALQTDGKIVLSGLTRTGPDADFALARLNVDGSPDLSFGTVGQVTANLGGDDVGHGTAIQPDGRILIVGTTDGLVDDDIAILRYMSDGQLDTSFGTGGVVRADFGFDESGFALLVQPDGKIVVTGEAPPDPAVARFNPDGSPDTGFGNAGIATAAFAGLGRGFDIKLQSDGKIVQTGWSRGAVDPDFALARYNSDGILDAGFGNGGMVTTDFGFTDFSYSLALQADGKVVSAGWNRMGADGTMGLARYNPNGSPDTTFGSGGRVMTQFGPNTGGLAVALQNDGKIIQTGGTELDFAVARFIAFDDPAKLLDDLRQQIGDLLGSLNNGQVNALWAKLDAAVAQLEKGKTNVAINQLGALVNQVNAFIDSGVLTQEEGLPIVYAASSIIIQLQIEGDVSSAAKRLDPNVEEAQPATTLQNYPNPFETETAIVVELEEEGHIRLVVYDVLGRTVSVLADNTHLAGRHVFSLNTGELPSGIYLARLETGFGTSVRQMLLAK